MDKHTQSVTKEGWIDIVGPSWRVLIDPENDTVFVTNARYAHVNNSTVLMTDSIAMAVGCAIAGVACQFGIPQQDASPNVINNDRAWSAARLVLAASSLAPNSVTGTPRAATHPPEEKCGD